MRSAQVKPGCGCGMDHGKCTGIYGNRCARLAILFSAVSLCTTFAALTDRRRCCGQPDESPAELRHPCEGQQRRDDLCLDGGHVAVGARRHQSARQAV